MAAVAAPLIEAFAPTIIDLIARLVHGAAPMAEQKFGARTGPIKFGDVFAAVMVALQNAAAAGSIPKALPSDEAVKSIIQAVVTSMNLSGLLGGAVAPVPAVLAAGAQSVTLRAGQSLTITVA